MAGEIGEIVVHDAAQLGHARMFQAVADHPLVTVAISEPGRRGRAVARAASRRPSRSAD